MPIITISRGSMSGGQALAECVAGNIDAPCVAREILVAAAEKMGVATEVLSEKLETSPGLWDRFTLERRAYVAAVQAALAERAASGHLVYHGQAGHLLLRGVPAVVRVRLIAPTAMRLRTVMERQHLRPDAAEAYIARVDEERARWVRLIYGVDLPDPQLYDVVINLEVLSIRSACSVVVETSRRPEFEVTEQVKRQLADFALASQVRLALATRPATRGLALDVKCLDGVVTVSGEGGRGSALSRGNRKLEQEVRSAVESVEGVEGLELGSRASRAGQV